MTKVSQLIMIFILFVFFISIAHASTVQENVIEVRGQAKVSVHPDTFSLTLLIAKVGRNTSKIRSLVDHKSNQVIEVAYNIGLADEQIESTRVTLRVLKEKTSFKGQSIEIDQHFPKNNTGKVYANLPRDNKSLNKIQNFELSRTITINFSTIEQYDKFLVSVLKLGVEHIYPLTTSITNSNDLYQQALAKAIDNAKDKAHTLAKRAKVTVGKVIYLQEQSSHHYQARTMELKGFSDTVNIHKSRVAEQAISASVLVKYRIK